MTETAGARRQPEVTAHRLADMTGGWFVGNFTPAALHCESTEVAVKHYRAGDTEDSHEHRIATEVTLIVSGSARMCGRTVRAGDILVLPPGTATGFVAIEDTTTVAVKAPSVIGDRYLVDDPWGSA